MIPAQGLGPHMPQGQRTKNKTLNTGSVVVNTIKTLKMVHIRRIFKKKTLKKSLCGDHSLESAVAIDLERPAVKNGQDAP